MLPFLTCTTGFDEKHIDIDRQVTDEEDPFEYNIEHGNGNFQGDMMLTPEQMEFMEGGGNERSLSTFSLWPRNDASYVNIPYTLKEIDRWSSTSQNKIQLAIDAFAEHTCIR